MTTARTAVGLAAAFALLPWLVADYHRLFAAEILVWGLLAMSFGLVYGYGGMLSFAQAVFFGWGCWGYNVASFLLHLRRPEDPAVRDELLTPHLERAIGVIYRPDTEMLSHYFQAALPAQFDEYIWFDETAAVRPLKTHELAGVPETYPFGL